MRNIMQEKYYYPNSDVLKNKLNIKEEDKLNEVEKQLIMLKSNLLDEMMTISYDDEFNVNRLIGIHQFLFDDLYDWSGEFREINKPQLGFPSIDVYDIPEALDQIMKNFNSPQWQNGRIDKQTKLEGLIELMSNLWQVQPFKKGNTVTCMAFALEFAKTVGLELNKEYLFESSSHLKDCLHLYVVGSPTMLVDYVNQAFSNDTQSISQLNDDFRKSLNIVDFEKTINQWINEYEDKSLQDYFNINKRTVMRNLLSYECSSIDELKENFSSMMDSVAKRIQFIGDPQMSYHGNDGIAYNGDRHYSNNQHYIIDNQQSEDDQDQEEDEELE